VHCDRECNRSGEAESQRQKQKTHSITLEFRDFLIDKTDPAPWPAAWGIIIAAMRIKKMSGGREGIHYRRLTGLSLAVNLPGGSPDRV
jgi:hypothetical protein